MKLAIAAALAALGLTAACTGSPAASTTTEVTQTRTVTQTRSASSAPAPTFTPVPARTVAPLPPGQQPARNEVERTCPYIASTPEDDPTTNVADIDGSHVYRTTVLTNLKPVGCRFYFYSGAYEAIAGIVPRRFASATAAHNAMVLTAEAGRDAIGKPNFVRGIDAVLYRTKFFGEDGSNDWACVFAAGRTMVIVHTQRTDTALNALLLARAISRKF